MTSLQRAAAYLKKMGPKAALAIVPLAVAAVPAQASILFNYTSGNWNINTVGSVVGSQSDSISGVPLAGSLIQGTDLTGALSFNWDSGGTITLTGTWSGNGTGSTIPFPATPISGYYDISWESDFSRTVSWDVTYNIDGTSTSFSAAFPFAASGSVSASPVNLNVPLVSPLSSWDVTLTLTMTVPTAGGPASQGNFSVDVAGIGISPENASAVPEPSTALLAAPMLAGLLIVRLRRRKR